jgi:hypothetical protein
MDGPRLSTQACGNEVRELGYFVLLVLFNYCCKFVSQLPNQQTIAGPYFWNCSIAFPSTPRCSTRICTLLFNVCINGLCDIIKHSRYLLFADDIKIYRAINSPEDCILLQSDVDSIWGWCAANCMKLNIDKSQVITFFRKRDILIYEDKIFQSTITHYCLLLKTWEYFSLLSIIFILMSILYFLIVLSWRVEFAANLHLLIPWM